MRIGNRVISKYDGGQHRPVTFEVNSTFPELSIIEDNYDAIKGDFENVNRHFNIPAYHEIEKRQYAISGKVVPNAKWKVFIIFYSGEIPDLAKELCPNICSMVHQLPNSYKVFFSVLEPGKSIPAHCGPYRGYLRYHMGIKVPKRSAPAIRIKQEMYQWKEGESILFDDTWEHEVYNQSKEERVVLIIDLLRPLPYFPNMINKIIARFLLKKVRVNKVLKDVAKLNKDNKS